MTAPPVDKAAREVERAVLRYVADRNLVQRHGDAALSKFRDGGFAEDGVMKTFVHLLTS